MKKNLLAIAALVLGLSATASAQDMMATPVVGKPTPKVEQAPAPTTAPASPKMEKTANATTAKATVKKHKKKRSHKKTAKKAAK